MTVDQMIQQLEEFKQTWSGSGDWELVKPDLGFKHKDDLFCYPVTEIKRENFNPGGNVAVIS